jgi:hypothetical protein
MMVPAIAFAWWFAALPAPEAVASGDELSDPTVEQQDDMAMAGERVKPKLITPAMVAAAESFVKLPLGTERYATVGGRPYVFVVERHYHPPGYVGGPTGWHNGVTMYELR